MCSQPSVWQTLRSECLHFCLCSWGGGGACLAIWHHQIIPVFVEAWTYCKCLIFIVTVRFSGKLFQNDGCSNSVQSQRIEFWNSLALNHKCGDLTSSGFSAVATITPCAAKSTKRNMSVDTTPPSPPITKTVFLAPLQLCVGNRQQQPPHFLTRRIISRRERDMKRVIC